MKDFFNEMKSLYSKRHKRKINPFISKWISPECIIMGTSLAEICSSVNDIRELFYSDLRYWYDLNINSDNIKQDNYGEYEFFYCSATLIYTINENKARYENYGRFCNDLANDELVSSSVKTSRIAYVLDTLLSSRKNNRRKNTIGVSIHVLMKNKKAHFISFSIDNTIDSTDCYYNGSASIMKNYSEEKSYLGQEKDRAIDEYFIKTGYSECSFKIQNDTFFYGVGLLSRNETREEAMKRILDKFNVADDYQSLFDMRLAISRLQCAYSIEDNPKAIVRFFGLKSAGEVSLFVPVFPNIYYLETK